MRLAFAILLALATASGTLAKTPHNADVAGAIAFLMPVHDGACPGLSFDPVVMSRMIDPKGLSVEAVRKRFKKDFDESAAKAADNIKIEGLPAYCTFARDFFGQNPGVFPGLVVR